MLTCALLSLSRLICAGAVLCNVAISGANLTYANLNSAYIEETDLNGAELRGAKLDLIKHHPPTQPSAGSSRWISWGSH